MSDTHLTLGNVSYVLPICCRWYIVIVNRMKFRAVVEDSGQEELQRFSLKLSRTQGPCQMPRGTHVQLAWWLSQCGCRPLAPHTTRARTSTDSSPILGPAGESRKSALYIVLSPRQR